MVRDGDNIGDRSWVPMVTVSCVVRCSELGIIVGETQRMWDFAGRLRVIDCCSCADEGGMSRRNDCRRSRFGWLNNLTLDIKRPNFNASI